MYRCKHYKIKELVNPEFLKKFSEDLLWTFFDERLLKAADGIRDKFGPCFVNTADGALKDCGARLQDSSAGSPYSAHKIFRALDLHVKFIEDKKLSKKEKNEEYDKIRTQLLNDSRFNFLNFEINITWLHIDTYNRANRCFNP
jgi:hypothetical protein